MQYSILEQDKVEMENPEASRDVVQSDDQIRTHKQDTCFDTVSERSAVWHKLVSIVLASFAVKCFLAWCFPFTGDEAYVVLWGKYLASGYYDHPPMTGWLLHLFMYLGQSPMLIRLPAVLFSTAIGVGIYGLLRPYDHRKAYYACLLYLLSPVNNTLFVILTDTPLQLFSFLSVFFLFRAEKTRSYLYYLLSGVFLGLAFLSKYFVILLAVSYLVYFLSVRKDFKRLKGFLLTGLGLLPFVVQNAVWNYNNGWPNIMHNWINRFSANSNPAINLLTLVIYLGYVVTPPVLYYMFKNKTGIVRNLWKGNFRIFTVLSLVPACVFFAVSFKRPVRPHWYFSFFPFVYIMAGLLLEKKQMVKCIKFSLVFSLVQVCLLIAVSFAPVARLKGLITERDFASLVTYMYPQKVLGPLADYKDSFVLATKSYSRSALFEYFGGEKVIVFGKGSRHGRQHDILTNFKELDGKNIVILRKGTLYDSDYQACFEKIQITRFSVEGATFSLVLGYGFKYPEYRERYLLTAMRRYYRIPDWLPGRKSFFHKKYDF
ncbi:MAG: glycosyltransferase family 39 protein [Planctomycetota bacterium]